MAERGFAFRKDWLVLVASVCIKKPERIMALALVMTLCLLVYTLAEVRVRQQWAATGQTLPDQVRTPTARPTLRWLFPCLEGIDLHLTRHPDGTRSIEVVRLSAGTPRRPLPGQPPAARSRQPAGPAVDHACLSCGARPHVRH